MDENTFLEELKNFTLGSKNYKKWHKEHERVFGDLFADAFTQNEEAQICFTAALANISQRNFGLAMPKLDLLENLCDTEPDRISVYYFKGLNFEMLGKEAEMAEYYEKLRSASVTPKFMIAFHPYYRTAKFAQRSSECSKALHYYHKALEFYDDEISDPHESSVVSFILYDIATLYLYMHEYDECERFLERSFQYDPSQNRLRDYVKTILLAVRGKREECCEILQTMDSFYRQNCQPTVDAILDGRDPHYCVIPQDRSLYEDFWTSFLQDESVIKASVAGGAVREAEQAVSQKLTKALGFMKRSLDCRIEKKAGRIVVNCKNYRVKSLIEEHSVLFSAKPEKLSEWEFVSVKEFEVF